MIALVEPCMDCFRKDKIIEELKEARDRLRLERNAGTLRESDMRAEIERLKANVTWQKICLVYQGDTKPCDTPCLYCSRVARALGQEDKDALRRSKRVAKRP